MNINDWDGMTRDEQRIEFNKIKQAEKDRFDTGKSKHLPRYEIMKPVKRFFRLPK